MKLAVEQVQPIGCKLDVTRPSICGSFLRMHYVTVFDASVHPYRNLSFVLPGLGFVVLGAIMIFRPTWMEAIFRKPFRHRYIFRWFFFLFSVFWVVTAGTSVLNDAINASRSTASGRCETVEGPVQHFHPMPAEGHDTEHFDVQDVEFSYSDYIVTAGSTIPRHMVAPFERGCPCVYATAMAKYCVSPSPGRRAFGHKGWAAIRQLAPCGGDRNHTIGCTFPDIWQHRTKLSANLDHGLGVRADLPATMPAFTPAYPRNSLPQAT